VYQQPILGSANTINVVLDFRFSGIAATTYRIQNSPKYTKQKQDGKLNHKPTNQHILHQYKAGENPKEIHKQNR
jgi:hypothetical protein